MTFEFQRKRLGSLSQDEILLELEKAAKHFNYIEFSYRDLNRLPEVAVSATAVKRYFGSWKKGLLALKRHLQSKGLDLIVRPHSPNRIYSDIELFQEMEIIWSKVGQRPSRTEWESSDPKISYQCYKQRFGGWINACLKFIEYKMGGEVTSDSLELPAPIAIEKRDIKEKSLPIDMRNVSAGLKVKVLEKDNFKCVFCGKSPTTDIGTRLHIDHIVPFSKGGKTILENLQVLCVECNLGKGAQDIRKT
ncbi:MAG: hypothetical protein GC136_07375 [Alphaproteobacteria bacterium]|nr:hypothetical protein [Alphaproteobacteria bacterium]